MKPTAIYQPGMSFREYRHYRRDLGADLPVVNASVLKNETAIDMKADFYPDEEDEEKSEGKESFVLGDAFHKAVLEPDAFKDEDRWFIRCETKGLDTKAAIEARLTNPGKIVVDTDGRILQKAKEMRDAVLNDDAALPYLRPAHEGVSIPFQTELTGVAPDPQGEFIRKIRVDLTVGIDSDEDTMGDYLLDLKSCQSADIGPKKFLWAVRKFNYHVQAAYYLDTDSIIRTGSEDNPRDRFIIIAVESSPPHKVMVYQIGPNLLAEGRETYRHRMAVLAQAIRTNEWRGYDYKAPFVLDFDPTR